MELAKVYFCNNCVVQCVRVSVNLRDTLREVCMGSGRGSVVLQGNIREVKHDVTADGKRQR